MKKIINRRVYDTVTSIKLGSYWNGLPNTDFKFFGEDLYRNRKGAYFIFGEGGALTKYSKPAGNMRIGDKDIIPISEEAAKEWAEKYLTAEEYEKIFGDVEEADGDLVNRERINLSLSKAAVEMLRSESNSTGKAMSQIVDKLIHNAFEKLK